MQSIFIVVDTNTGRFFGAFTEYKYALGSIALSYSRTKYVVKQIHEDVWNTDFEVGNDRLTIKRVQPKDFVEHL